MAEGTLQQRLENRVRRGLRLPPEPEPPWGDPASVRTFRAAPGALRLKLWGWGLSQLSALTVIVLALFGFNLVSLNFLEDLFPLLDNLIQLVTLGLFSLEAAFSWAMIHVDHRNRWYILTDRCLRIREGVWTVREMTLSLTNIQNISLRQGPLQRLFGIADVEVRTAGGGARPSDGNESASMHIGRLRGITDAEAVRDRIAARWRAVRKAETMEEQSTPAVPTDSVDPTAALLAAGRALELEARALGGVARG